MKTSVKFLVRINKVLIYLWFKKSHFFFLSQKVLCMWTRVFAFAGVSECVSCATLCNIFFLICFRASPSACECLPLFRRHSSVSLTPSPLFYSLHPNVPPPACDCISVCVCVCFCHAAHTHSHTLRPTCTCDLQPTTPRVSIS